MWIVCSNVKIVYALLLFLSKLEGSQATQLARTVYKMSRIASNREALHNNRKQYRKNIKSVV